MGLFDWLFPKKSSNVTHRLEMISDNGNGFYSFGGNLYKSDIVRACIRPFAKAAGKMVAKHILDNKQSGAFKINPNVNIRFLLEEPNPLMSGQMMQEKIATHLKLNNNAFIYMKFDNNMLSELWPVPCSSVEAVEDNQHNLFLKFQFSNGKTQTIPYKHIIHLRNDFNGNDIFGDHPRDALLPLMNVISTVDQGMVSAVKNSAVIKWILKFNSTLRPEDMKQQTKDFTEQYLSIDSNMGGAAATDAKFDATQVKDQSYVPDDKQIAGSVKRVQAFFGTNEKIIMSTYTEDEWNSYYEAEIEPFAMQMSNEYTRKLFSRRERGFGNSIVFESTTLQYASMSTKLNLVQLVDRGIFCANDVLKIFNMPPIEGGNEYVRRLDTVPVSDERQQGNDEGGEKDASGQPDENTGTEEHDGNER
ncbi:phage portal protein [Bacillus pumilus]|uniref:Phage portal protein n=1 Tax=Bacillus pumilus TaxID=1408 RepID=A0AAD0MMT2_BACPU|nr:phage portal protein [Bacillus pumilus]AVM24900.1 phage portal protein [Bacillus pumilus]TYS42003.1 phage portal protein [Bacillus pumilus]